MKSKLLLLAWMLAASMSVAQPENWPAWRGPRGDGTSMEKKVPTNWSATSNVVWKTVLPGQGHSSPIVWADRLFLTTGIKATQERVLLCLDRPSGCLLWQQTVLRAPLEAMHSDNSYASSTPATDGRRVYVTFLDGKEVLVAAYDFSGKRVWAAHPGGFFAEEGFGHTPILFQDEVILNCDSKNEAFIVALDARDGHVLWKNRRENPTKSYCAPLVRDLAGRLQMIVLGDKAVISYDPTQGKTLWYVDGPSLESMVTPVYNENAGLLITSSSFPKRVLMGIRPDGQGNVTETKVVWRASEGGPYVPAPISQGDWFYTSSFDTKEICCFEAATGRMLWHEKAGLHHASPVAANGLLYFLNDNGVMNVFKAGPKFELVARNELGEKTYASPAISAGRIYLRTFTTLYCIGR